ncbi:MAG: undecaprenyl-diphosphate phosphatase [Candidatus Levybacteria bacterium]|nr:undecaprenyl-diphosphate phosphatase [Candidatus Levybacteria bacterium]
MDYLQTIIFSIVEGFSEFLPISSTGHLVLTADLLKIPQTDFIKSFEIIIQLGAIFAIIFLYWKTFLQGRAIWEKVLVAFLPTAILGFTFYKIVKNVLLGNTMITLGALFLGGIALIVLELIYKEKEHHVDKIENLSLKTAFFIGLFQSLSMIPGVSRSAATIIGGLLLGTKRKTAVEFSFLLAVPTMFAATGLDLIKSNLSFDSNEITLLAIGFLGAFTVAVLAVKFFLNFIQKHTFIPFGVYRIILAVAFYLVIVR